MPFKIGFGMTWLRWLSHCIIFQIRKRTNKLPDYQMCCLFFWFFLFNPSKKNALLEPRTGHFWGLVGFEAKAKDLSFEAKVKTKNWKCALEAKDVLRDSTSGFDRPEIWTANFPLQRRTRYRSTKSHKKNIYSNRIKKNIPNRIKKI